MAIACDHNPFFRDDDYLNQIIRGENASNSGDFVVSLNTPRTMAVIGSYLDSDNAPYSGVAFIFRLQHARWVREATLVAEDFSPYDGFGTAVAIDKKGTTVVIGATMDSTFNTNAGAVYVFRKRDCLWHQQKKLFLPESRGFQFFGQNVAINDEGSTIVVESESINGFKYTVFQKHFQEWRFEDHLDQLDPTLTKRMSEWLVGQR